MIKIWLIESFCVRNNVLRGSALDPYFGIHVNQYHIIYFAFSCPILFLDSLVHTIFPPAIVNCSHASPSRHFSLITHPNYLSIVKICADSTLPLRE